MTANDATTKKEIFFIHHSDKRNYNRYNYYFLADNIYILGVEK